MRLKTTPFQPQSDKKGQKKSENTLKILDIQENIKELIQLYRHFL